MYLYVCFLIENSTCCLTGCSRSKRSTKTHTIKTEAEFGKVLELTVIPMQAKPLTREIIFTVVQHTTPCPQNVS